MDRPPQPWKDSEKLDLFANIIRFSNVSPDELFRFIAVNHIGPNWNNTPLPHGELSLNSQAKHPSRGAAQAPYSYENPDRTIAECQHQFEMYKRNHPYSVRGSISGPTSFQTGPPFMSYAQPSSSRTAYDMPSAPGRVLLPKTAPNTPSEGAPGFPGSPTSEQPQPKKRGRPPKEEVARRKEEALSRGEVYPPPRSKRLKRVSVSGSTEESYAIISTPAGPSSVAAFAPPPLSTPTGAPAPETGSDSSGSKRRKGPKPSEIDVEVVTTRRQVSSSYGSPPPTSTMQGQPSASITSGQPGQGDVDVRIEGSDETLQPPTSRGQSYREIVGIRESE